MEELEAIQNGWEQELRVERERQNALRMLEASRERTRLAIKQHSRVRAEWEARQARAVAIEHRVNVEFNNQAKVIFNWLRKRIKCSQFHRNYKNAWKDICQKKIAGLKILICWHSGVIYRNMKKRIKERVSIGKLINGLNQMMRASNNSVAVENGSTDMMRGGTMRRGMNDSASASMIGAWNNTAAVDNGLIHETIDPSQDKTADQSQNLDSNV